MTRVVGSNNSAALASESLVGCVLAFMDFPAAVGGPLYLSDGFTEVTYAGQVYSPLGQFAGIELVEETMDSIARPIKLILSGVDANIVAAAQVAGYQNREVIVYVGIIDKQLGTFIDAPEIAWEGRMDFMAFEIDKGTGKVTLNCEHRLRREPKIARYTDVDQQQLHPGDTFFNFLTTISGFRAQWGDQHMTYGGPARPIGNVYYFGKH